MPDQKKKALHQIITNYNAVDLEIAFGGLEANNGGKTRHERIDLALLTNNKLTFIEVKMFSYNNALRRNEDATLPPVCDQLQKYNHLIKDQEESDKLYLTDSYKTIFSNFSELNGGIFDDWKDIQNFEIDYKTKLLIIYDCDEDKLTSEDKISEIKASQKWKNWEKHEAKIIAAGHDIIYYFMHDEDEVGDFDFSKSETIKKI